MVDRTRYSDDRSRPFEGEGDYGRDEGSDGGFIAQRGYGHARSGYGGRGEGRDDPRSHPAEDQSRVKAGRGGFEDRDYGSGRGGHDYGGGMAQDYRGSAGRGFDEGQHHADEGFRPRHGYGTERGFSREDYAPRREASRGDYSGAGYPGRGYGGRDERGFFDRAGDEIASWFGSDDAERRRRQDAQRGDEGAMHHRGRGPKNYQRSDERIREDVNDRLTEDPRIDASEIEVHVENREVTLTGTVGSRFAKRHAEDIAEHVSGVTHVQNNIRVRSEQSAGVAPGSGMDPRGGSGSGGAI